MKKNNTAMSFGKFFGGFMAFCGLLMIALGFIVPNLEGGTREDWLFPVGGVLLGIAAICFIASAVSDGRKRKIIETGVQTEGIITNVVVDRTVSYNHRHPYKAECTVTDASTGEQFLYSSESVMENIEYLIGSKVTVYYDRTDRSRYYVDLDSAHRDSGIIHDFR